MNSKAIRKQLLAAVAMVLVAAVALGSSTYAWFVASSEVTATGMKVQAQSEGNLVIRYLEGNWGSTAKASDTMAKLTPASTPDLARWVNATADDARYYYTTGTYTDVTSQVGPKTDDGDRTEGYALVKKFQIRCATANAADAAKGLYVDSIDVTRGTKQQNMSGSLRVGVQCVYNGEETPLIFAPVGSGANAPKYGLQDRDNENSKRGVHLLDKSFVEVTPSQVGLNGQVPYAALLDSDVTLPLSNGTPVDVYIYVWFEGEDENLYSDNFAVEDLAVSVVFKSIPAAT